MIKIGPTEEQILRKISTDISEKLEAAGLFHRVFSRIKSKSSIEKKLYEKREEYSLKGKKMQDVFGLRITLYFLDDEEISIELVKNLFNEVPEAHSVDELKKDQFGPIRNNLVFRISDSQVATSSLFDQEFIDSTFEVQFRTVYSEGWHEVEHDLRYKCKTHWSSEDVLSRQLNGQLAALETLDWAMLKIFDELAYKKYKQKEWNAFFRNILRIRFEDTDFSPAVLVEFDKINSLAKNLLKTERGKLISSLILLKSKIPLKMDNVLYIINRNILNYEEIISLESPLLSLILDESFPRRQVANALGTM
jgi:putative GTP pyrophosphokinase